MGTAGPGSPSHVAGVLFQKVTGTRFQFVPYRGVAPVIPDLIGGNIDIAILDPITTLPQIHAGRIKAFAMMAKSRTPTAPDIPTVDEGGAPGVYMEPWQAIFAPKGTPKDIVDKLNASVVARLPNLRSARSSPTRATNSAARPADAGVSRQIPEGRDRQVVADHQGRRHQGRLKRARGGDVCAVLSWLLPAC